MSRFLGTGSVLGVALAGLLGSLANAGQIRVPADQPTLAAALAVAAPNDVILVQTPVFQNNVVVTKPVTIIGEPLVTILGTAGGCSLVATVNLAGPGSGSVAIANARILSSGDCFDPAAPIGGGGFASLFLYDVEIPEPPAGMTGYGHGVEGVRTSGIPFVAVERCSIRSSQNDVDECQPGPDAAQLGGKHNHAAVDVGNATLLALDSTLRGGNGGFLCTKNWVFFPSCVSGLDTAGGEGASAVKAGAFYAANSIVESGVGSTYLVWQGIPGGSQSVVCWVYGSYPAVIASTNATLPGTVTETASPKPGSSWQLDFALVPGATYALFSFGFGAPLQVPGIGTAFLDPATFASLGVLSALGGVGSKSYGVPNDASLLGTRLCLQPLQAGVGLLRPVGAVIVP